MRKTTKLLGAIFGILWALPVWAGTSSDYTKLEYIESTGTQYIDTGYKFSAGNKFEVVLNPLNDIRGWFFGANSAGGEVLFSNGSIYFATFRPSTTSTSGLFPTTNTIYKITGDMRGASSNQSSLLIDDNLIWQGTGTFNDRKIYLFAYIPSATDESSLARQKIRIYGFKIWQNDTIVQDLIPVKRHSDGVICMYDMVTGNFFENIGTGTFVAGPVAEIKIATTKYNESAFSPLNTALANAISVVDTVVSNTITQAASIATLQAQKQTRPNDIADDSEKCPAGKKCLLVEDASGVPHWYEIVENAWDLPVGYTQLQYIESTGTQWIDTGYTPTTAGYSADVKFMLTGDTKDNQTIIGFNAEINGVRERMSFGLNSTGVVVFGYGNGSTGYSNDGSDKITLNNIINLNVVFTLPVSLTIDGNTVFTKGSATRASTTAVYLMAVNTGSGITPSTGRWYSTKIYNENNTLVRDFIPAKDAGGVVGMYDLVGGRFYENAGTGEFIAGDPVVE
ncbi:MAG: hypothetical protein IJU89_02605 [Alphaproteobacteria bacterium]|nr:hypothetical protein [Alphaproteobacteria bacterium]